MKPSEQEILSESTGTKLDAWVAEYIYGWPQIDEDTAKAEEWNRAKEIGGYRDSVNVPSKLVKMGDGINWMEQHFFPSDHVSDAFDVADKTGLFKSFRLAQSHAGGWFIEPDHMPRYPMFLAVSTPADAICKAALLIKMRAEQTEAKSK